MEMILNEGVKNPSTHWLEPVISFELGNTLKSQLDLPITSKAFVFRSFEKIEKAPTSDTDVYHMVFSFYLKYGRPQYHTWSSKKIAIIKVFKPAETEDFINVRFKALRGASNSVFEFTLADLPCLNPYDWISLFSLLSKDEQKYEPILAHLKGMLVSYI